MVRRIGDEEPAHARRRRPGAWPAIPSSENYPYLLRGLESANPVVVNDVVAALAHLSGQAEGRRSGPVPPVAQRAPAGSAAATWAEPSLCCGIGRNGREFGFEKDEADQELAAWVALVRPGVSEGAGPGDQVDDRPRPEGKYKFAELLDLFDQGPGRDQGRRRSRQDRLHAGPMREMPQVRQRGRRRRPGPDDAVQAVQAGRHSGIDRLPVEGHQRSIPLDDDHDEKRRADRRPGRPAGRHGDGACKATARR